MSGPFRFTPGLDLAFTRLMDRLDKKAGCILAVNELIARIDALASEYDVQDEGGEA